MRQDALFVRDSAFRDIYLIALSGRQRFSCRLSPALRCCLAELPELRRTRAIQVASALVHANFARIDTRCGLIELRVKTRMGQQPQREGAR